MPDGDKLWPSSGDVSVPCRRSGTPLTRALSGMIVRSEIRIQARILCERYSVDKERKVISSEGMKSRF